MTDQLPALIIISPLLAALLANIAGWIQKRLCFPAAVAGLLASFLCAAFLMRRVIAGGPVVYRLAGWNPPWGISYYIDNLSGAVLILVSLVALINMLANREVALTMFENRLGAFYSLYLLFVTGLMGIVITGDAFNLYVLLEIASLTGYALIGMGGGRARISSLHYVFMGTIGASLYLFGTGYLYMVTGSLNMADLAALLPQVEKVSLIEISFILCLVGLFIKMAFFPLHAWLPNAYSHAPGPSASLIAPLTTKVMIYVMIRVVLSVYRPEFVFKALPIRDLIIWIAVAAILAGSVMAFKQRRLKRMLSYIIVVEVAYMVGGFWLGNAAGMTGAMLHLLNDAMMTLCLFLAAGSIVSRVMSDEFSYLQGVFQKMPFTMVAFVAGALSVIGVPPTCGFFSKWYLISGGIAAGQYGFAAALIISSLINALLFFRVIEIGYFEPFDMHSHGAEPVFEEASAGMVVPLVATAGLILAMGFYANTLVAWFIEPIVPVVLAGGG